MRKELSDKTFAVSALLILFFGLAFLAFLYYLTNVQYQTPFVYSKLSGPVTTAPKSLRIDMERPDEDTLTFDDSIIISGTTGPNMEVLITSNSKSTVLTSKPDGNFSLILDLDQGVNKIRATVFDSTGDSREVERTVYYSKEKI